MLASPDGSVFPVNITFRRIMSTIAKLVCGYDQPLDSAATSLGDTKVNVHSPVIPL